MKWIIKFFTITFLFCFQTNGAPYETEQKGEVQPITNLNAEPSTIVNNAVNVISGHYIDCRTDIIVPGATPIEISRTYCSDNIISGSLSTGWDINHHGIIEPSSYPSSAYKPETWYCKVYDTNDCIQYFTGKYHRHAKMELKFDEDYLRGVTNCASGIISGKTNIKNTRVLLTRKQPNCQMEYGDGTQADFGFKCHDKDSGKYYLDNRSTGDGNSLNYTYEQYRWPFFNFRLAYINAYSKGKSSTLASASFHYPSLDDWKIAPHMRIFSGDGREVVYQFIHEKTKDSKETHRFFLSKVSSSFGPWEKYTYSRDSKNYVGRLIKKTMPENRFMEIEYNFDTIKYGTVKNLKEPIGADATPLVSYSFDYLNSERATIVTDARKQQTRYEYSPNKRLKAIIKGYKPHNNFYSKEVLVWDKIDPTRLSKRIFQDNRNNTIFMRCFEYDKKGNILTDILSGNLTGTANPYNIIKEFHSLTSFYIKKYTYSNDGFNSMTSMDDGRKVVKYTYYPNTNQIKSELTYVGNSICKRKFYHYRSFGPLSREILDDGNTPNEEDLSGVTHRFIHVVDARKVMPTGLPNWEEDRYLDLATGEEKLIKRTTYQYTSTGNMTEKRIYDCHGNLAKTERTTYNEMGLPIEQVNPLGEIVRMTYDCFGNLLEVHGPDPAFFQRYSYDFMNRLITEEMVHSDGKIETTRHRYDLCSNRIATIDPNGHEILYSYDPFGRMIKSTLPKVQNEKGEWVFPILEMGYDHMSYQNHKVDPMGNIEKISYTVYGKPYKKTYPNGSSELFEYHSDGTLYKSWSTLRNMTSYEHDYEKRPTKETVYDCAGNHLHETTKTYNAFHLLRETDVEGKVKKYAYYPDGKLRSTTYGDSRTIYEYDSLGRRVKSVSYYSEEKATVEACEYDLLDRIIEERTEDLKGKVFTKIVYQYDCHGNRTEQTVWNHSGCATIRREFDAHQREICVTDPLGNQTHTLYIDDYINAFGQKVLRTETTDSQLVTTIGEYDALKRLVKVEVRDPFGNTLRREEFVYDLNGNKVRYTHGDVVKTSTSVWEYNASNQVVRQIEAYKTNEQQTVTNTYNGLGQKIAVDKPDGIQLKQTYDSNGRLKSYLSSDNSIHYLYHYDTKDRLVKVEDLIQKTTTEKKYDASGRLEWEKLANGLSLCYNYDRQGRPTKVSLPDGSQVAYEYNAAQLKKIVRLSQNGQELYRHQYKEFDLSGHPLYEQQIGAVGLQTHSYDSCGRLVGSECAQWKEEVVYNCVGNVVERITTPGENETYQYDFLGRLIHEEGNGTFSYNYDALHNRLEKNGRSQTLNKLNQVLCDGENTYHYDLNGNLIKMEGPSGIFSYCYDAMDRLISVKTPTEEIFYTYDEQNRRLLKKDGSNNIIALYLYQGFDEVGAYHPNGSAIELRVLGKGKGAEIGAAIAIEVAGTVYAPINDGQGNIAGLINAATGDVVERYAYSAFGELKERETMLSPWGFSSKRFDSETKLVYFGRRYYAPWLGKWITPDPIGHDGGPNLYAYVNNNPLTLIDLYGLSPFRAAGDFFGYISRHSIGCHVGKIVGSLTQLIGDHIIPVPYVRDIFSYTGMFIQKGTKLNYTLWANRPSSGYFIPSGDSFQNHTFIGSGVNVNKYESEARRDRIAKENPNVGIGHFYGEDYGLIGNLIDCIILKLGFKTQAVKNQIEALKKIIEIATMQNKEYETVYFHSRGGITGANAIKYLTQDEKKMLRVYTFGSGTMIHDKDLKAVNYISNRDPIPYLSDLPGIIMGLRRKDNSVVILSSKEKFPIDHAFEGATYKPVFDSHIKNSRF